MAYNQNLAARIAAELERRNIHFEEKKMMGGWCLMVNDKMCLGVVKNDLMARVHPDSIEQLLLEPGCRRMDFTGKPLKGFVFVDEEALVSDAELDQWIQRCLDYNPLAKSSKKK